MRLAPVLVTAPSSPAVSLEEAKKHCRVDHPDDDQVINGFVASATRHLEVTLSFALVTQTWRQDFAEFGSCMRLPKRPVVPASVVVSYRDEADVEQTLTEASYHVLTDQAGTFIVPASGAAWPAIYNRPDAVSIRFDVGADPAQLAPDLKVAVLMHVAHLYEHREAISKDAMDFVPLGYDRMIERHWAGYL